MKQRRGLIAGILFGKDENRRVASPQRAQRGTERTNAVVAMYETA
jgi:hypothetical protein